MHTYIYVESVVYSFSSPRGKGFDSIYVITSEIQYTHLYIFDPGTTCRFRGEKQNSCRACDLEDDFICQIIKSIRHYIMPNLESIYVPDATSFNSFLNSL